MKKMIVQVLCLFVLSLSYIFVVTPSASQAQTDTETETKADVKSKTIETHSFPGVSTFMTSSGRLGFFEQGTGKIYLYDSNLENCVFTGQLKALGEPITPAKK